MISKSVAQIATASIRTRTSARLGTGTGFSVSFSSPGLPSTHALNLSGMGKSGLVFTPGPEYMARSSLRLGAFSGVLIVSFGGKRNGPQNSHRHRRRIIGKQPVVALPNAICLPFVLDMGLRGSGVDHGAIVEARDHGGGAGDDLVGALAPRRLIVRKRFRLLSIFLDGPCQQETVLQRHHRALGEERYHRMTSITEQRAAP